MNRFLLPVVILLLPLAASAQITKGKWYSHHMLGGLCKESFIFYDSIGYYSAGCEANSSFIGAFRYHIRGDSMILEPFRFEQFPLLARVLRTPPQDSGCITMRVTDMNSYALYNPMFRVYKKGRKKDHHIGDYKKLTPELIRRFSRSWRYYWTLMNAYPLYANEFTMEFGFKEVGHYQFWFNAPAPCLQWAKLKDWVQVRAVLTVRNPCSIGFAGETEVTYLLQQ